MIFLTNFSPDIFLLLEDQIMLNGFNAINAYLCFKIFISWEYYKNMKNVEKKMKRKPRVQVNEQQLE